MDQKEKKVWLEKEVENWKNDDIIDENQAQKILSKNSLAKTPEEPKKVIAKKEASPSRLIAIISILGATLIGTGVILFVASNWEKIPQFVRLILLLGLTYSIYFAGWKLEYDTKSRPRVGTRIDFFSFNFCGCNDLFMCANISC